MSDVYDFTTDINKMNFKQLRNEVQLLRDELAKMKRSYEDILYNLDNENFSTHFIKEKDGMISKIEQNEKEIELTAQRVDGNETNISGLQVTADGINANVTEIKDAIVTMQTDISINAEGISSKVSKTDLDSTLENYSQITQTANAIRSVVQKGVNLDEAYEMGTLDEIIKDGNADEIYVVRKKDNNGCVVSETYYYFSELTGEWEVLSGENIHTVFEQTKDGFNMKGNVKISGDLITEGTISADRISTDIAQVDYKLNIGAPGDYKPKQIYFNSGANISTYEDHTGEVPTGIRLNSSSLNIYCGDLSLTGCYQIRGNWDFSAASVTLPSDANVTAVFA